MFIAYDPPIVIEDGTIEPTCGSPEDIVYSWGD